MINVIVTPCSMYENSSIVPPSTNIHNIYTLIWIIPQQKCCWTFSLVILPRVVLVVERLFASLVDRTCSLFIQFHHFRNFRWIIVWYFTFCLYRYVVVMLMLLFYLCLLWSHSHCVVMHWCLTRWNADFQRTDRHWYSRTFRIVDFA